MSSHFRHTTLADAIYDLELGAPKSFTIVDPLDLTRRKHIDQKAPFEDLLVPVFRSGKLVYQPPPLAEVRQRAQNQLASFSSGIKRLLNPHLYPVGLELGLSNLRTKLILKARGEK